MGIFGGILNGILSTTTSKKADDPSGRSLPISFPSREDDKCTQTKKLISEAKQLVSDGEAIYTRAKESADRACSRTQRVANSYINFCKATAQKLNTEVKPAMMEFDAFNIDARIDAPSIDKAIQIPSSISSGIGSVISKPSMPSILDMILDEYQYEKAKTQRDSAKAYKEEMKVARSELYALRDKLDNISNYIESEQRQIDTLTQKVLNISQQLKTAMQRTSFTPDQAKYLKAIQKIAVMIADQISTEFVSNQLEITDKYKNQANLLNKVNAAIPATPSIDGQEVLNLVRNLKDIIPIET